MKSRDVARETPRGTHTASSARSKPDEHKGCPRLALDATTQAGATGYASACHPSLDAQSHWAVEIFEHYSLAVLYTRKLIATGSPKDRVAEYEALIRDLEREAEHNLV